MQKLLATSAIAMIALSGAAFAQVADADFTEIGDNDSTTIQDISLLADILNQAQDVQIAMTNAAENLANLDGSINVLESANVDLLLQEITSTVGFGDGGQLFTWEEPDGTVQTGTQSEYEAAVDAETVTWTITGDSTASNNGTFYGTMSDYNAVTTDGTQSAATDAPVELIEVNAAEDLFAGLLQGVSQTVDGTTAIDFFDPASTVDALQTDITNLTTTVIGALNTGVIGQNSDSGIAANTLAMANMQLESVAQTTGSLANSAQYFEPGDLQLSNFANNMAEVVDASVNVDQLMANVDTVSTTLIGALNTGDIAADVNQNASNLTQALVGQ
jgi:hypothetical protein